MRYVMRRHWICGLACLGALGFAMQVSAHPHQWVDYRTVIQFDAQGRITGMHEEWAFDPMFSADLVQQMNSPDPATGTRNLLREMATTLEKNHYLTHFFAGTPGKHNEIAPVDMRNLAIKPDDDHLVASFDIALKTPYKPTHKAPFSYQIYDNTYFIEYLHTDKGTPITVKNAPKGCSFRVIASNPDPALVSKASMIDVTGEDPTGLGRLFSDIGEIACTGQ